MKLTWLLLILPTVSLMGCIEQSLRRHTVNQADTWSDIPYRQVMENLAMVANNSDVLPCYSVIDAGSTNVNDTYSFTGGLNFLPKGTGNGAIDPNLKRSIGGNWVLTQVTGPEKLRALHLAFKYAVTNDTTLLTKHDHHVTLAAFCYPKVTVIEGGKEVAKIVNPPAGDPLNCDFSPDGTPGYYFGVAQELEAIPPCWLNIGCKQDIPRCARFVAHCCDTYVWVTEDGMEGLSHFTLGIQRIARIPTEQVYAPMIAIVAIKKDKLPAPLPQVITNEQADGIVAVDQIQLPMNCYGHVVIPKLRGDAIQTTDTKLKSALTGVIKSQ